MFPEEPYELTRDITDDKLKHLLERFINQFTVTSMTICVAEEDTSVKSLYVEYEHPGEIKDTVYFGMDENFITIELPDGDAHKAVNFLAENA